MVLGKSLYNRCFQFLFILLATGCTSYQPKTVIPSLCPVPEPGTLYAQYFGISTIHISDGHSSIMIDGVFTRRNFSENKENNFASDVSAIKSVLNKACITKVDGLFVSHAHFDHSIDAGKTSQMTDAILYASSETFKLTTGASKKVEIVPGKTYTFGNLKITAYETGHVPKSPFVSAVEWFLTSFYANGGRYLDAGPIYTFHVNHQDTDILIVPSASLEREKLPVDFTADAVFLSIGLLSRAQKIDDNIDYMKEYWENAVVQTGASLVIPIHYDNFGKPISPDNELSITPNKIDDITATIERLESMARDSSTSRNSITVAFPPVINPFLLKKEF